MLQTHPWLITPPTLVNTAPDEASRFLNNQTSITGHSTYTVHPWLCLRISKLEQMSDSQGPPTGNALKWPPDPKQWGAEFKDVHLNWTVSFNHLNAETEMFMKLQSKGESKQPVLQEALLLFWCEGQSSDLLSSNNCFFLIDDLWNVPTLIYFQKEQLNSVC